MCKKSNSALKNTRDGLIVRGVSTFLKIVHSYINNILKNIASKKNVKIVLTEICINFSNFIFVNQSPGAF